MKKITTVLLVIAAIAFTSCSDTSLEDNEEILQFEFEPSSIEKDEYEIPPNGIVIERQDATTTNEIEKDEYEIPPNG